MEDGSVEYLYHKIVNSGPECKSLLKKYLTPAVFNKNKNVKTKFGGTLADCIRSGMLD